MCYDKLRHTHFSHSAPNQMLCMLDANCISDDKRTDLNSVKYDTLYYDSDEQLSVHDSNSFRMQQFFMHHLFLLDY